MKKLLTTISAASVAISGVAPALSTAIYAGEVEEVEKQETETSKADALNEQLNAAKEVEQQAIDNLDNASDANAVTEKLITKL